MNALAFALRVLSFAILAACGYGVARWLCRDFATRRALALAQAKAEAAAREVRAPEGWEPRGNWWTNTPAEPIFTQLCADIAERESRFIETEWWLRTRNGGLQ